MSGDEPRHPKRRRSDDGEDAPASAPTRSDIWYDDGNIILQAENTQLCVHRGVLSKSSSVFRDMFAVGRPGSQSEDVVDGVPVVHLSDSRVDLEWIVRALYGDRRKECIPCAMVEAYVRLGLKYEFEDLYHEGVQLVLEHLPSTLHMWNTNAWSIAESGTGTVYRLANLCVEANLQIALPAVLYGCSIHPLKNIVIGALDNDTGRLTRLSPSALEHIASGRDALERRTRQVIFGYLSEEGERHTSAKCTSATKCRRAKKKCFCDIVSADTPPNALGDSWEDLYTAGLCTQCSSAVKKDWEQERQKLWDELPSLFDLPSWEELSKDPYPKLQTES